MVSFLFFPSFSTLPTVCDTIKSKLSDRTPEVRSTARKCLIALEKYVILNGATMFTPRLEKFISAFFVNFFRPRDLSDLCARPAFPIFSIRGSVFGCWSLSDFPDHVKFGLFISLFI